MATHSNEPSLGTATSTDMETQLELAIEAKVASWLKEKVAAEIVRFFHSSSPLDETFIRLL